jgi:orotidine-5'-phosphate decarboxylase
VCKYGLNQNIGLLINSSRAILYASSATDFAQKAGEEAKKVAIQMQNFI